MKTFFVSRALANCGKKCNNMKSISILQLMSNKVTNLELNNVDKLWWDNYIQDEYKFEQAWT